MARMVEAILEDAIDAYFQRDADKARNVRMRSYEVCLIRDDHMSHRRCEFFMARSVLRNFGTKDARASRQMLALASVLDGRSRTEAAEICGMDRQTLR